MSGGRHRYSGVVSGIVAVAALCVLAVTTATAHVFILEHYRLGSFPPYDGSGWVVEAFTDIPDESASNLIVAERYISEREPDFTFRTDWIDFPAGPVPDDLDVNFATIGDFLNDYIYDVSDPSKLDEPFGHLLLRFKGLLRVALADDVSLTGLEGLPVWVEFGTLGHDGYRTRVVDTIYRLPIVLNVHHPFFHENLIVLAAGLFPIEVTYFNRYEPDSEDGLERAGIELYSWHGGGLPWPGGNNLVHAIRGPSTIVPPRVIYQPEDVLPLVKGDYDSDFDIDLLDFRWFQVCYTGIGDEGKGFNLELGCKSLDFDDDQDVDGDDLSAFHQAVFMCADDSDCHDADVCTYDRCIGRTCANTLSTYGDVDHNGTINVFDLLCILNGFAGDFSVCSFEDDNIEPCTPNGTINIFDLLAVLGAFAGTDPCCSGPAG